MKNQDARNSWLRLTKKRLAFDDALGVSNSAVEGIGDEKLRLIAHKLVDNVRQNLNIN